MTESTSSKMLVSRLAVTTCSTSAVSMRRAPANRRSLASSPSMTHRLGPTRRVRAATASSERLPPAWAARARSHSWSFAGGKGSQRRTSAAPASSFSRGLVLKGSRLSSLPSRSTSTVVGGNPFKSWAKARYSSGSSLPALPRGARPSFLPSKRASSPSTSTRRFSPKKGKASAAARSSSRLSLAPSKRVVLVASVSGSPSPCLIWRRASRQEKSSSPKRM
jgi:hypothetical protein